MREAGGGEGRLFEEGLWSLAKGVVTYSWKRSYESVGPYLRKYGTSQTNCPLSKSLVLSHNALSPPEEVATKSNYAKKRPSA